LHDRTIASALAYPHPQTKGSVEWPHMCNIMQRHLLQEIQKSDNRPFRSLSTADFEYFHEHFFAKSPVITIADFNKFWEWYGKAFQVLRFQKHINTLYQLGYVHSLSFRWCESERKSYRKWNPTETQILRHLTNSPFVRTCRYVFGFLSYEDATKIVTGNPAGTFLVVFSEKCVPSV
jgi:hypothetical protein